MSLYIITALQGKANLRSVVGFFHDKESARKEFIFQANRNRHPKAYIKETTDVTNRRIPSATVLSGAQEVDLFKGEPVKKAKAIIAKVFAWNERHKAARTYALADKGDPFAYDRAMSLMASGAAEPKHYEKGGRA